MRYPRCMRNGLFLVLPLLALTLSCGDDEPTRPEDRTVTVWESCRWDGQVLPQLCESDLVCTNHGICAPTCTTANDCPAFEGFEVVCGPLEADYICEPRCNADDECPQTGGAELKCVDSYCVGVP